MHILYVAPTYPPKNGWGGIGTYTYHMARGMRQLGHRVTVFCHAEGPEGQWTDEAGVQVINRRMTGEGAELRERIGREVEQLVAGLAVDIVEGAEYGAEVLAFQRKHAGFPVVVRLHVGGVLCVWGNDPGWKRLARHFVGNRTVREVDQAERESAARAHVVTSCCAWLVEEYSRRGWALPERREVILNPILMESSGTDGKDYDTPTVLWLGRVDLRKGAELLPGIMKGVWREHPAARFIIAGYVMGRGHGESYEQWIMRHVGTGQRGQVEFLGGVGHGDVTGVLAHSGTAFFASTLEGLPYSHMEAMGAGLACVIASGGGARELGKDGESVILAPRRAVAIAGALAELLRSPERKRAMGERAAEYVRRELDPGRIAARSVALFEKVIDHSRKEAACFTTHG